MILLRATGVPLPASATPAKTAAIDAATAPLRIVRRLGLLFTARPFYPTRSNRLKGQVDRPAGWSRLVASFRANGGAR